MGEKPGYLKLKEYRIDSYVGQGGFGKIYRVKSKHNEHADYALKIAVNGKDVSNTIKPTVSLFSWIS